MQKKEGILKDSDQRGPNAEDPVELKVYLALKNKPPNLKFVCHYETGGTPLEKRSVGTPSRRSLQT
jgi:hypothetical protein